MVWWWRRKMRKWGWGWGRRGGKKMKEEQGEEDQLLYIES
jgi:hypothetical protein